MTPVTGRTEPASGLLFINSTQLGMLLHACTSVDTGLSLASPCGSSVIQRAHVLHCVNERKLQPHSSASCHGLSAHTAFLWGCNSHDCLDSAGPDGENLTAFWGPSKTPGKVVSNLASDQLDGYENVLGKVTFDLRGGHGSVGPSGMGVLVQDYEWMMYDAGCGGRTPA